MANQYTLKNGGYEPFIGNFGLVPQPPIPAPEAADNGKVLGVSNGSYALVNGGGGGGATIVDVIAEPESTAKVAQIESKELYDLYSSGTTILFKDFTTPGHTYMSLVNALHDDTFIGYIFTFLAGEGPIVFMGDSDTANPRFEPQS